MPIVLIPPSAPEYAQAWRMIFDEGQRHGNDQWPWQAGGDSQDRIQKLLFGAFDTRRLVGAALAVESPGKTALVFFSSPESDSAARGSLLVSALRELVRTARRRSLRLLEALLVPNDSVRAGVLADVGFGYLTQLYYHRRPLSSKTSETESPSGLQWVAYEPRHEPLFRRAAELSYVQTQDCPELTDVRSSADILAGHRAAGGDPFSLWCVALRDGEPVGILLLAPISHVRMLEIVYLGVAQPARGTGVADALLGRALRIARERGDTGLALAVDGRNQPALRLYRRWNFVETMRRDAWIATPFGD